MTVADELRRVRERIADPEHWTQGASARRSDNIPVPPHRTDAVKWCLLGACHDTVYAISPLMRLCQRRTGDVSIVAFNDSHDHGAILALVDDAIAVAA